MKNMRKLLALALAVMMVLSLATTAFAYSIEITDSADGTTVAGHTYNVYQIFTGDLMTEGDTKVLSNVVYGQNYGTEGEEVSDEVLDKLAAMSGEAAAAYLKTGIKGDPFTVLNDGNNHKTDLAAGYYLIVDVTEELPDGETSTAYILQVVGDVTVNSKHSATPKVEKKVDDKNDSNATEDAIVWQDGADHDIGDAVPFKLEMVVPANFAQFVKYGEAYKFVFHDKESDGLAFNPDSVVVKVNGTKITTGYEVVTSVTCGKGCTFDIVFADLTKIDGVGVGSKITVEYTSTLTEDAVIGSTGNTNEVFGEYRNIHDPETPEYTPEDKVVVFTYKVVVDKTDENEKALAGAEFTLEKFVANTEGTEEYKEVKGTWVAQEVVMTEAGTQFSFSGLDDGEYRLTESKTPAGYNTIDPIYFTVTADNGSNLSGTVTGDETTEITFAANDDEGSLSTTIINESGTELPSTGGMGTTLFYVFGGILVLAAVVLLVTKKRMTMAE